MSDDELVHAFNAEVGNRGWTTSRASYLAALHFEFDRRGFDYSVVGTRRSISLNKKIRLMDKKIVIDETEALTPPRSS